MLRDKWFGEYAKKGAWTGNREHPRTFTAMATLAFTHKAQGQGQGQGCDED